MLIEYAKLIPRPPKTLKCWYSQVGTEWAREKLIPKFIVPTICTNVLVEVHVFRKKRCLLTLIHFRSETFTT